MKITLRRHTSFSALLWQEDNLYIAKCIEIELASQGKTKKEAIQNLKEAIELYFEDEPESIKIPVYKNVSVEKLHVMHA